MHDYSEREDADIVGADDIISPTTQKRGAKIIKVKSKKASELDGDNGSVGR
jgi:hypothetical protein